MRKLKKRIKQKTNKLNDQVLLFKNYEYIINQYFFTFLIILRNVWDSSTEVLYLKTKKQRLKGILWKLNDV